MEGGNQGSERPPDKPAPTEEGASPVLLALLEKIGRTVGPVLLAAGGLIGFVAFAGSIIVWTRFSIAQVPPDQVVAAFPRGELVAIASSRLLLFGFVGIVAVAGFFLISKNPKEGQEDRDFMATTGIFRGLLALFAVEAGAAIYLVSAPWIDKAIAGELFLLAIAIAFWFTFIFERPALWRAEDGAQKPGSQASPKPEEDDGFVGFSSEALDLGLEQKRMRSIIAWTVALVSVVGIGILVLTEVVLEPVAIAGVAVIIAVPSIWLLLVWVKEEKKEEKGEEELAQRVRREPGSIPYTRRGQALIALLLLVAAIVPALVLKTGWLVAPLIIGGLLVMGVWRVAVLFDGRFSWYGLAVFIAVVFFGAFTWSARDLADPQVQPVALIRQQDGPDEALQGIYVTETSDRIYFATVATEGCTNDIVPHSGRLLWVPRSDVVAMSIGPLQSIDDAAKTALEMSYALTPAVETPAGDHVSLTVAEKRESLERKAPQKRRLEDVGAAIQPNFGAGLRLKPENVSPGEVVTLKMAAPNEHDEVEGFGSSRQGRTLRLGGVPVDILKEEADSGFEAEYVETSNGHALNLVKDTLYTRQYEGWVEAHEQAELEGETPFVRLADESAMELNERGQKGDNYLPLNGAEEGPPRLDLPEGRSPEVTLDDGSKVILKTRLLRQAWHEDRVKFRVPENASTGAITVECRQLAGQPLLRVAQPPRANIAVEIVPGSRRVIFDSGRSSGKDKIVSRQWWVEGVDRGRNERMAISLPPRPQIYTIRLTVTDSEGQTGTSHVRLLRLHGSLFSFDKRRRVKLDDLRAARAELRQATAVEPAAAIEFGMRPGDLADPPNPARTIDRAEEGRRYLLKDRLAQPSSQPANPDGLVIRTMAFGGTCPAERDSEVGRLDVVVLGQGARMVPPEDCPVVRLNTARWLLPPP
jgi:hypothetical protein